MSCVGVERLEGDDSWQRRSDIFTFNIMVDACAKRWNFSELDLILLLLAKEGVAFEVKTYQAVLKKFAVTEISQVQSLKAPSSFDLWSAGCAHLSIDSFSTFNIF
ncbi:hypothetical protein ABKV19_003861 [Rosa sericea]